MQRRTASGVSCVLEIGTIYEPSHLNDVSIGNALMETAVRLRVRTAHFLLFFVGFVGFQENEGDMAFSEEGVKGPTERDEGAYRVEVTVENALAEFFRLAWSAPHLEKIWKDWTLEKIWKERLARDQKTETVEESDWLVWLWEEKETNHIRSS